MASTKLINCRFPRPGATYRLICFPWVGGGSNFYAGWGKNMNENIEVIGLTMPGREARFTESFHESFDQLMTEITSAILDRFMDKPLIFWGHSLGSYLAFETALHLKSKTGKEPVKMFLSGSSAPHSPKRFENRVDISALSHEEIVDGMRKMGGTPKEILDDKEMMKLLVPCLRADYKILDSYTYSIPEGSPPLSCPIDFFEGMADSEHDIEAWESVTSEIFTLTMMHGSHFYLLDTKNRDQLIGRISREFSSH